MKAFFLFFAAVFVALTPAQAYIENPNLFPLGEQEALMANTGVALAGSSGAVFYNPAGLATLEKPKFSMSANSYLITKTDFTPFDNIDSTNVNFSTSGSQAIPSSLVSVHKWDTWTVAFSLLVPQQTKNQDIDDFETKSYKVQLTQSIQTQFLLFGLSAGAHLTTDTDIGAGCFLGNYTATADKTVVAQPKPGTGLTINGFSTTALTADVKGLLCNAGIQKDYSDRLRGGFSMRLPFFKLDGKGKYSAYSQDTAAVIANTGIKKVSAEYDIPLDLLFGLMFRATDRLNLITDVSYQWASDYTPLEGSATKVSSQGTLRWNGGFHYEVKPDLALMGGLAWNPSTQKLNTVSDVKENFLVGTAGIEMKEKIATTGVGLFYTKSTGESLVANNGKGSVTTQGYGLLLTGGFAY